MRRVHGIKEVYVGITKTETSMAQWKTLTSMGLMRRVHWTKEDQAGNTERYVYGPTKDTYVRETETSMAEWKTRTSMGLVKRVRGTKEVHTGTTKTETFMAQLKTPPSDWWGMSMRPRRSKLGILRETSMAERKTCTSMGLVKRVGMTNEADAGPIETRPWDWCVRRSRWIRRCRWSRSSRSRTAAPPRHGSSWVVPTAVPPSLFHLLCVYAPSLSLPQLCHLLFFSLSFSRFILSCYDTFIDYLSL